MSENLKLFFGDYLFLMCWNYYRKILGERILELGTSAKQQYIPMPRFCQE